MNLIPLHTHAANDPLSSGLTLSERVAVQQGPWFRALPAATQEAMLAQAAPHHLPAGATLGSRGIARSDWFVVTRGSVRLGGVFANGRPFALRFMRPGEWFGQMSAADDLPSVLDSVAQTDCAVLALRSAAMKRLVTQHPALLPALLQMSYARLAELSRLMDELQTLPLPARLARKILWVVQRQHGDGHIRLSQDDWADLVVASRPRINGLLRAMQRDGVLQLERGALQVLSMQRLRELAQPEERHLPRAVA